MASSESRSAMQSGAPDHKYVCMGLHSPALPIVYMLSVTCQISAWAALCSDTEDAGQGQHVCSAPSVPAACLRRAPAV